MGENGCSNNVFVPISNFVSQLAIGLLFSLLTADENKEEESRTSSMMGSQNIMNTNNIEQEAYENVGIWLSVSEQISPSPLF